MKRLLQLLTATLFCVVLTGGIASAQVNIGNTGPGSDVNVDIDESFDCDVNNDNDVDVDVDNDQDADSGDAEVDGNTNAGDATSGDASNDSDVDVNVDIDNGNPCVAADNEEGGQGGGPTVTEQPTGGRGGQVLGESAVVAVLPNTGAPSVASGLAVPGLVIGTLGVLTQAGVALYRRFSL